MLRSRLVRSFVCLFLSVGWAGMAPAATYSLCGNSAGQLHIGDGLMLPIQAAATAATTGTKFPTLLVPLVPGATVTGTTVKPLLTAMAVPLGPVTKSGYQRVLSVPAGVLKKAATQTTVGVHFSNPTVFAVGTNLTFTWPAAPAVFSTGAAVGTTTVSSFGGSMVYSNTLGARFGGPASFALSPGAPAGLIAPPVTVYIKINASPTATPACTHPGFTTGGTDGNCVAGLIAALPTGLAGQGGPTATTVMTPGLAIAPNVAILKMGLTPSGTILLAAGVATAPIPTNMATSQPGPWTTGKVVISNALAAGAAEKFTLSGKDSRTAGGAGNIQLVSGALSTRPASGINANRGWLRLELKPPAAPPLIKRTFKIVGSSDMIEWSWRIAIGGSTVASKTAVGPIANGGLPPLFATEFISSITANAGASGCTASPTANSDEFEIACTCAFEFYVNDAPGTGLECKVSQDLFAPTGPCMFNPTIFQVLPGVPSMGPSALLALGGLLLAMFVLYARSRRSSTRAL